MSGERYTPEFKDEAVKLITERGYSVTDVAERLGVSQHSIYKWLKVQPLHSNSNEHEQPRQIYSALSSIPTKSTALTISPSSFFAY